MKPAVPITPLAPLVFGGGLMVMQSQQATSTNQTPISKEEVLAIIDEALKLMEEDLPEFDRVSMLPKN
jgi:hypothetical protein